MKFFKKIKSPNSTAKSLPGSLGHKRGTTLAEMIIYIGLMTFVTVFVVRAFIVFTVSWESMKASRKLATGMTTVLERLAREVRSSPGIDISNSVFATSSSKLVFTSGITSAGGQVTVYLATSTGRIMLSTPNTGAEPITPSIVKVNTFYIYRTTNTQSQLLRFIINASSTNRYRDINDTFYLTASVRNQYKN